LEQEETRKKSAVKSDQSKSERNQTRQGTMLENSISHEKVVDIDGPIEIQNVEEVKKTLNSESSHESHH
jgi:hypothetical protein